MTEVMVMPTERVRKFLQEKSSDLKVIEIEKTTHTSELAAKALGVEVAQIAKSLLFLIKESPVLVVTCGDMRVDTRKLKEAMNLSGRASMAGPEETKAITGFPPGGVCPFALDRELPIFLDVSLGRFPVVYAAAGSPHSLVPISFDQLKVITGGETLDVCKK
jgi:prolyl-tRNA editing enzyme YbaK/EbsC (Cys-tRNA(Pro) deacylase)